MTVEEGACADTRTVPDERVLGMLVDLGAELAIRDRLFVRLLGQDRWMPGTGVDPIPIADSFGSEQPCSFAAFDLPGRYVVGGVGVGIRF